MHFKKHILFVLATAFFAISGFANELGAGKKVTAYEGIVEVFENGINKGDGACKRYSPGDVIEDVALANGLTLKELTEFAKKVVNDFKNFKNACKISYQKFLAWFKGAGNSLFKVDNSLKSADEIAGVLVNGSYLKNPTAKNVVNLIKNPSGTMKLDQSAGSILNGQYMYVVDEADNIIIGTRATGISPFNGKAPHPTLVGGVDPTVKTAGIIEFRAGKIYKVDNVSGHFKPSAQSLQNAKTLFNQKFSPNNFAADFQGFIPHSN